MSTEPDHDDVIYDNDPATRYDITSHADDYGDFGDHVVTPCTDDDCPREHVHVVTDDHLQSIVLAAIDHAVDVADYHSIGSTFFWDALDYDAILASARRLAADR